MRDRCLVALAMLALLGVAGAVLAAGPMAESGYRPSANGGPGEALSEHQRRVISFVDSDAITPGGVVASGTETAAATPRILQPGPAVVTDFAGLQDSDPNRLEFTSTVGEARYIEMLNRSFRISDKQNGILGDYRLSDLFSLSAGADVRSPQVIWDTQSQRFFLSADIRLSESDHRIGIAFSKDGAPTSLSDFCAYQLGYGEQYPGDTRLGNTADFLLFGTDVYGPPKWKRLSSELVWMTKPGPLVGGLCPSKGSFKVGAFEKLTNAVGRDVLGPAPAVQVDPSATGVVIARALVAKTRGGYGEIVLWRVTRANDGSAAIDSVRGRRVRVAPFWVPGLAKQPGAKAAQRLVPTGDARFPQAFLAVNPSRADRLSLWTQHTVAGLQMPAVPRVRWYELDPETAQVLANGELFSLTKVGYYSGAIAPDRAVSPAGARFGDGMILHAVASSGSRYPSIVAISKIGDGPQSGITEVKSGTQSFLSPCNGDGSGTQDCWFAFTAGLAPDPTPPESNEHGRVWGTNQIGAGNVWSTWNFVLELSGGPL